MQKRWLGLMGLALMIAGLTGCQCCPLTNHSAGVIDAIAEHEHDLDVVYHPCLDLTRIGRPDWCHCGVNRLLCQCRCDRCKPLPHIVDTTAAAYVGMNCPWDNRTSSQPIESDPAVDPLLDAAESQLRDAANEETLDVPPPKGTDGTSFQNDVTDGPEWTLDGVDA